MPSDRLAPHVDRGAPHRRAAIRQPSVECPSATVQPDVPCGVRLDRTRFGGTARARCSTIAVSPPAELGSVPYIAWKLRVIIVRTSGVNAYGGGGPPQRSIAPKMSPVRRKFPFAWGSKRYLAFGTDGDVPVSLTCSARERPGTAKSACHRSINRGYGWRVRACVGGWGGFRGWCLVCRGRHHF